MPVRHTPAHQREHERSRSSRSAYEVGPAERQQWRDGYGSAFECDRGRDEHMSWRDEGVEDYLASIETHGPTGVFRQLEPRSRVIAGGWDICPVCVRKSEVEYGAESL